MQDFKKFFQEDEVDKKELESVLTTVISNEIKPLKDEIEELKQREHKCRFRISEKEAQELSAAMNMISILGENNSIVSGLEVMRENHKWMRSQRERSAKLSMVFITTGIIAASTAFFGMIWVGFKKAVAG